MKDKGYWEVIQNLAWEIHNLSEEAERNGESPEEMVLAALNDPEREKFWVGLDDIMHATSKLYEVSLTDIQIDSLAAIMEYHFKNQGLIK